MATIDDLAGVLVDASPLDGDVRAESPLIGARRVLDTDLPKLQTADLPLVVHLTGGAGQLAGPAGLCRKRELPLAALTVTLRDLDDLAGNVRRVVAAVDAARGDGVLPDEVAVRVAMPPEPATYGWLAAADEVAAAELGLAVPLASAGTPVAAGTLAGWIDAALDREVAFAATGGASAARSPDGHGVLNLLAATAALWDGGGAEAAAAVLEDPDPVAAPTAAGRRWCVAVEVPDPGGVVREIGARLAAG